MARRKERSGEEATLVETAYNTNGVPDVSDDGKIDTIEETKETIEDLFEKAEAYVKTSAELYKLKTADKFSVIIASLVSRLIVIIFVLLCFLMINIGLAIWLGESMGHTYYGFFIVAGLYALIAFGLFIYRDPIIKNPIINSIISQILK